MPKSAKLSTIKSLRCYTIPEAAEITGVSDRTIRAWITQGLPAMTLERPKLVRGDALIAFIQSQRAARKTLIAPDEFYCLKCRAARKPADRFVECEIKDARASLTAICGICETILHKPVAVARLQTLSQTLDIAITGEAGGSNLWGL